MNFNTALTQVSGRIDSHILIWIYKRSIESHTIPATPTTWDIKRLCSHNAGTPLLFSVSLKLEQLIIEAIRSVVNYVASQKEAVGSFIRDVFIWHACNQMRWRRGMGIAFPHIVR